jgi:hypothetical protein
MFPLLLNSKMGKYGDKGVKTIKIYNIDVSLSWNCQDEKGI